MKSMDCITHSVTVDAYSFSTVSIRCCSLFLNSLIVPSPDFRISFIRLLYCCSDSTDKEYLSSFNQISTVLKLIRLLKFYYFYDTCPPRRTFNTPTENMRKTIIKILLVALCHSHFTSVTTFFFSISIIRIKKIAQRHVLCPPYSVYLIK